MISGRTRYYAILGNPIEQALSPIIQNAAFRTEGKDAVFLGCKVEKGRLGDAVKGARALGFSGLAVTMPYKREIIPYLDTVSRKAEVLDAVNVVTVEDGRFCGHNTDGDGFVQSLLSGRIKVEGQKILLFGAGGAARGIALSLLEAGAGHLYLCNLFEEEAKDAMEMLKGCGYGNMGYLPFEKEAVKEACRGMNLVVNATCLGMAGYPSAHMELLCWEEMRDDAVFADIVHKPLRTPLLKKAAGRGHRIVTGDGMLLHQGILAYKLLTGEEAPREAMRQSLDCWLAQEQGE